MKKTSILIVASFLLLSTASPVFAVNPTTVTTSNSPFQGLINLFVKLGIISPDKAGQANDVVKQIDTKGSQAVVNVQPVANKTPASNTISVPVSGGGSAVTPVITPAINRLPTVVEYEQGIVPSDSVNNKKTNRDTGLTILRPIGGEQVAQGESLVVIWNAKVPKQPVKISILDINGKVLSFPEPTTVNPYNEYSQSIGFSTKYPGFALPIGQYKARVCLVNSNYCVDSPSSFSVVDAVRNISPQISQVLPQPVAIGSPLTIYVNNAGRSGNIILMTMDGSKTWTTGYGTDIKFLNGFSQYDGSKMTFTIPSTIGRGVHPDGWWNEPTTNVTSGQYQLFVNSLDQDNRFIKSNVVTVNIRPKSEEYPVTNVTPVTNTVPTNTTTTTKPVTDNTPALTVLIPINSKNHTTTFSVGENMDIQWYSKSSGVNKIYLVNNSGVEVATILATNDNGTTPFLGDKYSWTIPNTVVNGVYRVKVIIGNNTLSSYSGEFKIVNSALPVNPEDVKSSNTVNTQSTSPVSNTSQTNIDNTPKIIVVAPLNPKNMTSTYTVGDSMNVTWSTRYMGVTRIYLLNENNNNVYTVYTNGDVSFPYTGSSYSWNISNNIKSGSYKYRVIIGNNVIYGDSGIFKIVNPADYNIQPTADKDQSSSVWSALKDILVN